MQGKHPFNYVNINSGLQQLFSTKVTGINEKIKTVLNRYIYLYLGSAFFLCVFEEYF